MPTHRFGLCVLISMTAGCAAEAADEPIAHVRVLHAVPGTGAAVDVQYLASEYPAEELEFGDLSPEFEMPAGAHPVALVSPPESAELPSCRGAGPTVRECAPEVWLASLNASLEADGRALIVFAERREDNREGLLVPLDAPHDGSPWNDSDARVRFVHAMPTAGTVAVDGVAAGQLRFGFRSISEYQHAYSAGLELISVRDDAGEILFEDSVSFEGDARTWTVVLIGDGSEQAPFAFVPVPG